MLLRFEYFKVVSFRQLNKTGTINKDINATNIPPKPGIAMGTIIPLPLPVAVKMGNKANIVVEVVIKQGRMRFLPASNTKILISF